MFDRVLRAAALAALFAAPFAGSAQAHEGQGSRGQAYGSRGDYSQVLSQLPADAPPGDCYARVKVPGEPAGPPPMAQGARWVLNAGPPGSPGPIWCLVPTGPVPVPVPVEPRFGWIRVLCDRDATPERIGQVQRRLHQRGYYRGEVNGRYDADTAQALARFQDGARIAHGGYLSLETLRALDSDEGGYAERSDGGYQAYAGQISGYSYSSGDQVSSAYGGGYAYGYQSQPQPYPAQAYSLQAYPCCSAQAYGYSYGGRGPTPPYASDRFSPVQNGWLTWRGKTEF